MVSIHLIKVVFQNYLITKAELNFRNNFQRYSFRSVSKPQGPAEYFSQEMKSRCGDAAERIYTKPQGPAEQFPEEMHSRCGDPAERENLRRVTTRETTSQENCFVGPCGEGKIRFVSQPQGPEEHFSQEMNSRCGDPAEIRPS